MEDFLNVDFLSGELAKYFHELGDVLDSGRFIEGQRDDALSDAPNIDMFLQEFVGVVLRVGARKLNAHGVKELAMGFVGSHHFEPELFSCVGKQLSEVVDSGCDFLNALGSVVDSVHNCNIGDQRLGSADIGECLFALDVLLACLQSQTIGGVSVGILADSDDSAWYFPEELLVGGEKGGVWSAVSDWHSESAGGANGHIEPHCGGLPHHRQRQEISGDHRNAFAGLDVLHNRGVVMDQSEVIRVLEHSPTQVLCVLREVERKRIVNHQLDS